MIPAGYSGISEHDRSPTQPAPRNQDSLSRSQGRRRGARGGPDRFVVSDFGALTALEQQQSLSDPVPRESCFELAGALGEVGPAFEMQRVTVRAPRILATSAA